MKWSVPLIDIQRTMFTLIPVIPTPSCAMPPHQFNRHAKHIPLSALTLDGSALSLLGGAISNESKSTGQNDELRDNRISVFSGNSSSSLWHSTSILFLSFRFLRQNNKVSPNQHWEQETANQVYSWNQVILRYLSDVHLFNYSSWSSMTCRCNEGCRIQANHIDHG